MSTQPRRLSKGGRIDRSSELSFTIDGQSYLGHPGDTVASALIAAGRIDVAPSIYLSRPRGIVAAGIEEPNALVTVRRPGQSVAESMLPATVVELVDGLEADYLCGVGDLDPTDDDSRYDKKYVHTDVLVIGGGPAGLAAAWEAAGTGARVILVDDQPELGGSLLSEPTARVSGVSAQEWLGRVESELRSGPEVTVLTRTSAFGNYDANYVIAVQNRTDHLGAAALRPELSGVSRQRLWHIRAQQVVVASGAHERPLVFANNDRPGVMLASAVRTYLNRYAAAAGTRVVIATTNDSVYAMLPELAAAGIEIAAIADARATLSTAARAARAAGIEVVPATAVIDTTGDPRVTSALISVVDDHGTPVGPPTEVSCDLVAVSGGWSPVVHLHSQRQGRLRWDDELVAFVPDGDVEGQQVVGAARGSATLEACLAEGARAGAAASFSAGFVTDAGAQALATPLERPQPAGSTTPLWVVRDRDGGLGGDDHFIDLQRDQTVADVLRATGAGMRSVEHIKRYTSISTANDQGKTSAVNAIGLIAAALNGAHQGQPGPDVATPVRSAPPRTGRRTHRSPSPRSPAGTAETCSTRPDSPRSIPGTSRAAPSSRSSASGCAPGTTRGTASRWTRPCCGSAPPSVAPSG